jgi:hypothetical protein
MWVDKPNLRSLNSSGFCPKALAIFATATTAESVTSCRTIRSNCSLEYRNRATLHPSDRFRICKIFHQFERMHDVGHDGIAARAALGTESDFV